jgi:hypothetical protein
MHARLDGRVECRREVGKVVTIWESNWWIRLRIDISNVGVEVGKVAGR